MSRGHGSSRRQAYGRRMKDLRTRNAAVPDVRSILTLHDVKIENWTLTMPEEAFVMESARFQALFVSVQDEG